ncbi:MAG: hypothetical protein M3O62_04410 [Pseudomonadota bacterium]|nr:hypothetical protein [Pseudomonadota bacterium]
MSVQALMIVVGSLLLSACGESAAPTSAVAGQNQTPDPVPPAAARISVGDEMISVVTGDGHVEIDRTPLALRFYDRHGALVLGTVSSETPTPLLPRLPLPSRVPGGGQVIPQAPALYAPLTFLVGVAPSLQFPATFWIGNLVASTSVGIEYRLTNVRTVSVEGNALRLRVATSDPSGREADVLVQPAENGSYSVSVRLDPVDQSVALISASFDSAADEAFHGFGGRRNKLDQRGEAFLNWAEEFSQTIEAYENLTGGLLGEAYQFPSGPQAAYYVQSLFVSDHGYGFLLDRDELSHWRMASDRDDAWRVEVAGAELDFLVTPGNLREVVGKLSGINGRHRVPPRWALGPMLSETIQEFADDSEKYTAKVLETLERIETLQLPITAFAFEGWIGTKDAGAYGDIIDRLRARGIKPLTYYRAFVGQQDDELEDHQAYEEAMAEGYVAKNALGAPYIFGSPLMGRGLAALVDFTNPDAVTWWKARIKRTLDEGVEGFMQDFGEQVLIDMVFADGSTGIATHNRNATLYHRATREAFNEYQAQHPDREPWFFTRSGYSGRHGSAHYESASWGGDNTADWSRASGIGAMIPDMLNRGIGGAYGFVSEIGGYIDLTGRIDAELLIRWANLSSLMPVHRLHGGAVNGTPMPWRFEDPQVVEQYRKTMLRHIAAQPLILDLWREALATGIPINRPMWLEYPDDPEAAKQDQQFMLGKDVLVAPVVQPGVDGRDVYFPQGCWQHPENGERIEGPQNRFVRAAVDELPYFFRCGSWPFDAPRE